MGSVVVADIECGGRLKYYSCVFNNLLLLNGSDILVLQCSTYLSVVIYNFFFTALTLLCHYNSEL